MLYYLQIKELINKPKEKIQNATNRKQRHIQKGGTDMFVTTGIGTSTIAVRFGVVPEISVITVYAE